MTTDQLEVKWKSITHGGVMPYRSLRIDAICIPELYLALDVKNNRFLILQVPENVPVNCKSAEKENLTIQWHEESRFILIGLRNNAFSDLFNDLTLSLYNRIKDTHSAEIYAYEFITAFHKWAEFFENSSSGLLSEAELKGLFGELVMLRWYLSNNTGTRMSADQVLIAWQGPFNKAQDFIFPSFNVEVKTKDKDERYISISSEFQLEVERGKGLSLAAVNISREQDGITIQQLINDIRNTIIFNGGDLPVFAGLLSRSGLNFSNAVLYNAFIWKVIQVVLYDCSSEEFPRITINELMPGISQVTYRVNESAAEPFIIQKFIP